MKLIALYAALWFMFAITPITSANDEPRVLPMPDARLERIVKQAVLETVTEFADRKLQPEDMAVTLVDLSNVSRPIQGSHRGDIQIYPASVVKLFYMAAAHQWLEEGKLQQSAELDRAMSHMIRHSYNEATHYIVDLLTATTSGPELSPEELEEWYYKRNAVNRYFASQGYRGINANRKPWCEGPYGREIQSVKAHAPNHRNWLTTDATARLLFEIATGKAVSARRSEEMLELMKRDPFSKEGSSEDQARGFTGPALDPGAKLWSKAGWTSETRHDAAYVELPSGRRLVLVTFTTGHASERRIIPALARRVFEKIERNVE